jgi:chemotaxis-related protein WspB
MRHLLMDAAGDSYAIATDAVVEVVPHALLKVAPGAPAAVAGIMNFRGGPVPVVDVSVLLSGRASESRYSTRIVLVKVRLAGRERLLGVLGENVIRLVRISPEQWIEPGARAAGMRCAGKVAELEGRWVQQLRVEEILSAEVVETLTQEDVA